MVSYRLTGRLEAGDLAELFRAERDDGSGPVPVVVKLFHPRTTDAGYAAEIAEVEQRLAGAFHSGIAHVIDIGLVKQRLAIVREDKGGFNLGQALQRLNTKEVLLSMPLALSYVLGLLELMQLAHDNGVPHGALTPGNVLISSEGRPAVCDFGALVALEKSPALKKNFGGRGRSSYRAPELSRGGEVSIESDIYSIGAITYELLTLKEASTGAASVSTRREAVPPPSRVDRRLNSRIDPVVMRALDPSPNRRFKSCKEMNQAMRDFLINNGGLPPKEELKRFVGELFPKEVNVEHMQPPPFTEKFTLSEVRGVELPEPDERSMVISQRQAFSGGKVDHEAATNMSLPALDAPPSLVEKPPEHTPTTGRGYPPGIERTPTGKADPEEMREAQRGRDELSWDAPPAEGPVAKKVTQVAQANVMKRVRVIEDFQGADDAAAPVGGGVPNDTVKMASLPVMERVKSKSEPKLSPFESQPIPPSERVKEANGRVRRLLTEEKNLRAIGRRRLQMAGIAMGIALLAVAALLKFSPETLWVFKPNTPVRPLPAFTGKDKPIDPNKFKDPPKPKDKEKESAPPPPRPEVAAADCYQAPARKGSGLLTVISKRSLRVEIDGDKVCQSPIVQLPVAPGRRKVVLTDLKTGQKQEQMLPIQAGTQAKLEAMFK